MDPTSGEYVTELEFKSRANEIIEFAIGTATYGKVRWVGSILTVDGARRAESLNNNYFLNGRHTPLLIMVKGGSLTDFEKACDNAVLRTAAGARRVPFGVEVALGYLIAKEAEWTAVRIVMAGRLAGLSADAIRERLRDTYV